MGARSPKVDIILLVGHRVLTKHELALVHRHRGRDDTLIIVRRALTEPKAAPAGVMLNISFARLRASVRTFNTEIILEKRRPRRHKPCLHLLIGLSFVDLACGVAPENAAC